MEQHRSKGAGDPYRRVPSDEFERLLARIDDLERRLKQAERQLAFVAPRVGYHGLGC